MSGITCQPRQTLMTQKTVQRKKQKRRKRLPLQWLEGESFAVPFSSQPLALPDLLPPNVILLRPDAGLPGDLPAPSAAES